MFNYYYFFFFLVKQRELSVFDRKVFGKMYSIIIIFFFLKNAYTDFYNSSTLLHRCARWCLQRLQLFLRCYFKYIQSNLFSTDYSWRCIRLFNGTRTMRLAHLLKLTLSVTIKKGGTWIMINSQFQPISKQLIVYMNFFCCFVSAVNESTSLYVWVSALSMARIYFNRYLC